MAFSTIQGSGGAPDSFVGTSGVDSISIVDSTGNFFLGAEGDNDAVTFVSTLLDPGVISNSTARGGAGNDLFLSANGAAVFNSVFFNGNAGSDTFTMTAGLLSATSIQGGQGTDTFTIGGGAVSSLINGNRDNDTITLQTVAVSASSIFGGQGNDAININIVTASSVVNGDDGNDTILSTGNISVVGTSFAGGIGNDTINLSSITAAANGAVVIDGGEGNDGLAGTAGNDTLLGGAGNDTLTGGVGSDLMTGGGGTNQFNYVFTGSTFAAEVATTLGVNGLAQGDIDVITDFVPGVTAVIDSINFTTGGGANFTAVSAGTDATYAAALADANASLGAVGATLNYALEAYGSGTSWTAVLFITDTVATAADGAIQIGATGAYATEAQALASLTAANIV